LYFHASNFYALFAAGSISAGGSSPSSPCFFSSDYGASISSYSISFSSNLASYFFDYNPMHAYTTPIFCSIAKNSSINLSSS
jgi:hypothetical protein